MADGDIVTIIRPRGKRPLTAARTRSGATHAAFLACGDLLDVNPKRFRQVSNDLGRSEVN